MIQTEMTTTETLHLLVVANESPLRQSLTSLLQEEGYLVSQARSLERAVEILRTEKIDLLITDLRIGDQSGMDLVALARQLRPDAECILLAARESIENAVEAPVTEAFDYVTKPFSNGQILLKVQKALEHRQMRQELVALRQQVAWSYGFDNIVGESRVMVKLKETAARIANTDINILITGASGTGKELLARTIHHHSNRRNGRFVAVDCSAIPEALLESQLFGQKESSTRSAVTGRRSLFEEADLGTLFLDEVHNITTAVQPGLLRFLQEPVIWPAGSSQARPVDVRVIAATNADLTELIAAGEFREDLFYRLSVVPLHLPGLSERREDIAMLAEYFLRRICRAVNRPLLRLTTAAMDRLIGHQWPGNVRELENTLKRAVALCTSEAVDESDILFITPSSQHVSYPGSTSITLKRGPSRLAEGQRAIIKRTLEDNNWNFTQTARDLGIGRTTLWRKVKKYNLRRQNAKGHIASG